MHFFERGDPVIPFQQRGGWPDAADGTRVKLPNRVDYRVIVGVEDVFLIARVAGDVDLGDPVGGNRVKVFARIEVVVHGADINVVHVEQDPAVGALDHFVQEFPFGHHRVVKLRVAADVFHYDRDFQKILDLADLAGGEFHRLPCVGNGQQVMSVAPVHTAPAEMVREPGGLGSAYEALQPPQMFAAQRLGRPEVHRNAMLHDAILFEDEIEYSQRAATIDHVVFRNNLEPVNDGLLF